jgi:hypothetical protein
MKPKTIRCRNKRELNVDSLDMHEIGYVCDQLRKNAKELIKKNSEYPDDVKVFLEIESGYEWGDPIVEMYLVFNGSRKETPEEMEKRRLKNERAKATREQNKRNQEKKERELYNKLKEKYEG